MDILAIVCGVVAGGALMLIELRHVGWDAIRSGACTLLDPEVREALGAPSDRHDKRLLIISAVAFALCIVFSLLECS
jgi:hypothetical protein